MLRESTQRRICRTLFLCACVAPTLAIAVWVAWRVHPARQEARLDTVGRRLGVRIACAEWRTPRPGILRLGGVTISALETNKRIARVDRLEVRGARDAVTVRGARLTIDPDGVAAFASCLDRALTGDWPRVARLRFDLVEITGAAEWENIAAVVGPVDGDGSLGRSIEVTQNASGGGDAARLALRRNRLIEPPATRIELVTGPAGVPWRLAAPLAPLPADLGPDARFEGRLTLVREAGEGDLAGALKNVDLGRLAPEYARLVTRDDAHLSRIELAWRGDRWTRLDVSVVAGAGEVDWPFALAMNQAMGPVAGPRLVADWNERSGDASSPVRFDQLALRVVIDASGARVLGLVPRRPQDPAACVAARGGRPLLFEPSESSPLPASALLTALAAPDAPSLLACPDVARLALRLPIARDAK